MEYRRGLTDVRGDSSIGARVVRQGVRRWRYLINSIFLVLVNAPGITVVKTAGISGN